MPVPPSPFRLPRVLERSPFLGAIALALLMVAFQLALDCQSLAASSLAINRVTTNGRVNPLGIAASDISFGWSATSTLRGTKQKAYQIWVGTQPGLHDIWDSGQLQSERQVAVVLPPAVTLKSATRYHWQVKTWDQAGNSSDWSTRAWFETGLLAESDWTGADWITRAESGPKVAAWTDYTATVEFALKNTAFGVFLRSSADGQDAYMLQLNVAGASPVLKVHKRTHGDYEVLATIDLSQFGFTNASLKGARNTLVFDVSGTAITTKLNGKTIDSHSGIAYANGVVGFRTFGSEAGTVFQVRVIDKTNGTSLVTSNFSDGLNIFSGGSVTNGSLNLSGSVDALYSNSPSSLPLLRGEFVARAGITSARLYASAQGLYEVSINGKKAGDQFLAPGWTNYGKRIQAQTYDITPLIQSGTNVIGAALADGWFRGKVGIGWTKQYGTRLAFIAKIKVTYADGSIEWFASNPGWKAGNGPYVAADLQDGESYNAKLEQPAWDTPSFNASAWAAVTTGSNVSPRLVPQPDEPIRQVAVLTAKTRTEIAPGKFLYDLGQNMVGVVKVRLSGTAGQTITLRHGEELYRTGPQKGQLYTANLRGAKAIDTYTFAENGSVTYQPKFTQHGFRYVEITGTPTPPAPKDVQGIVISSDLTAIGDLHTSNAMLNQLVSNTRWGQCSNFLSIPTDTPARDERLGWTGDINVFAPAAARYKDTRAFLRKWMADVRDAQKANGNIPAVVPQPGSQFEATGVGWSDCVITVPYSVWRATGDEQILRENWPAMKAFYRFVSNSATADGDLLEQGRGCWFSGDWLSLEPHWNRVEEHKVIATAYFAEDTRMMAEMAAAMGDSDESAQWASLVPRIRSAFVSAYRNGDGSIYQGTQCAYAMTLGLNLIADSNLRGMTAERFADKLGADHTHLQTGFLGTPWLLPALTNIGRNDLAFRILLNKDFPSWGFPISMGATTNWERWNSIQPDGTFGDVSMNSFNHYAYGAVADWMFGNIGGIQALEPGYKKALIAPLIGYGDLTSGTCYQETVFGRLATSWSISGQKITLRVEVPVNTNAIVYVPAKSGAAIYESGIAAEKANVVELLARENSRAQFLVGSGTYVFTSTAPLMGSAKLRVSGASAQPRLVPNGGLEHR